MKRYRPELWQGRTEDQVTLAYASCLALEVMPGLVPLNFDLGLTSGESLLICQGLKRAAEDSSVAGCAAIAAGRQGCGLSGVAAACIKKPTVFLPGSENHVDDMIAVEVQCRQGLKPAGSIKRT